MTPAPVVGPGPAPGSTGTPPPATPINAVESVDLAVRVPPDEARAAAVGELSRLGFCTNFTDPWHGVAERGSKGMNVAFGAMSQYFRIDVHLLTGPNGETVIRLLRAKTGYFTGGGLVGRSRTATTFRQVVYDLEQGFQQRGLLLGVSKA